MKNEKTEYKKKQKSQDNSVISAFLLCVGDTLNIGVKNDIKNDKNQ